MELSIATSDASDVLCALTSVPHLAGVALPHLFQFGEVAAAKHRVTIPMPGKVESLNAAAAGAVCLFEMVRQRGGRK